MSNVPRSGDQGTPLRKTAPSQNNGNSSTQKGQPSALTEEQKATRRERNKRRKQNRQRNKAAKNAASNSPAIDSKPPKKQNEPQNKRPKLPTSTPTVPSIPVVPKIQTAVIRRPRVEPKPSTPPFKRFNDFPLWIRRRIFEMAYEAHTNCIGWGDPEDAEHWSAVSNQVNEW